jgi:tetratricopeptide (TPR) repeat protein
MSKEWIQLTADFSSDFTCKIIINRVTYIVHTEEKGGTYPKVISQVFEGGKLLFSKEGDYSHLVGQKDFVDKLNEFMKQLHKSVIDQCTSRFMKKQKKKSETFVEIKNFLKNGKSEEALSLLKNRIKQYPSNPFLLSYYGYLMSFVAGKPKEGIKICRDAITKLNKHTSYNKEFLYSHFYLNLGRAYLGANKKREANLSFNHGLKADPSNKDLIEEMKKLGIRGNLSFPFLHRSNPINKYIGLLLRKSRQSED